MELRGFQEEVVEAARHDNLVMVGATGIGKTFVAIALLSEQNYSDGKRAIFMAPTRQLVLQISAKTRSMTTLRVGTFCGQKVQLWDAQRWRKELQENRVYVCTPVIIHLLLHKGYLRLDQVNLMIFDECHHVGKRHPYAHIMKVYDDTLEKIEQDGSLPRIFGTTACPTKQCAEKLHSKLHKVETNGNVEQYAAIAPMLYETYGKKREMAVVSKSPADDDLITSFVQTELVELNIIPVLRHLAKKGKSDAATDGAKLEKMIQTFARNCLEIYTELGSWCMYHYMSIEVERLAVSSAMLLTIPGARYGYDKKAIKLLTHLEAKKSSVNLACTAKVGKIVDLLRTFIVQTHEDESESDGDMGDPSPTLQAIVFEMKRAHCRVLTDILNAILDPEDEPEEEDSDGEEMSDREHKEAKLCACMLGRQNYNDAASFQLEKLESTLTDFTNGRSRVLVSTSVSAEGVDFPSCALVIVADKVDNSRKLLQLKGRARHDSGAVYYLGEEGDVGAEVHFKKLVKGADAIDQLDFTGESKEGVLKQPRSTINQSEAHFGKEDYSIVIEGTGARLDLDSSIQCLNMFCQSLPQHMFTVKLASMYSFEQKVVDKKPRFQAFLNLPKELELPEFFSGLKHSKSMAKAEVAFLACRELLLQNLLDDKLNSLYRQDRAKAAGEVQQLNSFLKTISM